MPTFSLFDGMHVRKNPWRETSFGNGEFYLASDPDDISHLAKHQDALADAAQENYSDCSGLDGMSRNACRARKISQQL